MRFALLHGEILVGILLGVVLGVCGLLAVALWWWSRPPASPAKPAAAYLLLAAVCQLLWMVEPSSVWPAGLVFASTLPWSLLYFMVSIVLEVEIPAWPLPVGVVLNAALIYAAAKLAGRRASARSRGAG